MADRGGVGDGASEHAGEPDRAAPLERRSVLEATPGGTGGSAARWLLVAVPLAVILVTGGFLVRSLLNNSQTIVTAWPEWWTATKRTTTTELPARPAPPAPPASPPPPRTANRDGALPQVPGLSDRPSSAPGIPRTAPAPAPQKPAVSEPWDFDAAEVVSRLASANLRNGSAIFTICAFCHTAEPAGGHRLGPKLWNILGREKASYADYQYSSALRAQNGRWTYEELARYLYDTRSAVPGGKMAFAGIRNPDKLADVIAFVRTLADNPQPLPRGP